MGTWGYEPKDSDGAMDLWSECSDSAVARLCDLYGGRPRPAVGRWAATAKRILRSVERADAGSPYALMDRAGAAQAALEAGLPVPAPVVARAAADLRALAAGPRGPGSWLRAWRSPRAAKAALLRMAAAFEALLPRPTARRRRRRHGVPNCYPWRGWPRARPKPRRRT